MSSLLARVLGLAILGITSAFVGEVGAQTCTPPRPGLVSWWDADAVSGTTAPDLKDGNPGSIVGGVTVGPDRAPGSREFNSAFDFDGKSGFVTMGNPAAFQFETRPFSLEAWFVSYRGGSSIQNIIRKSNYPASSPGAGYWIRLSQNTQTIEFFVGETVGVPNFPRALITAPVSRGVWIHVVGTKDPAGNIELYLDGRRVGGANIAPTFSVNADAPFTLGAWNDGSGRSEFFSGHMNDIAVYDRALSPSEIHALFITPKCKR
jgi:Concanavalin A-like lectin/glucanases superfamily